MVLIKDLPVRESDIQLLASLVSRIMRLSKPFMTVRLDYPTGPDQTPANS